MLVPPSERPEFHHRDEPSQILNFHSLVLPVDHAGQVKQLRSGVDFCPKPMFQSLLRLSKLFVVLEVVEVSKNPHDSREPVDLADVEELECLHFETEPRVDEEENQIGDFGYVYHRVDVVVAFNNR